MNKSKIILVGPAAAGKDYIKSKFREKGFVCDVSYTTRPPRENESYGVDYNFISKEEFLSRLTGHKFYEYVEHGEYMYGTGLYEWNNSDVFIMEADGVNHISCEDRSNCLIIYVNAPEETRIQRMIDRGWNMKKINERIDIDKEKFKDFKNYDIVINSIDNL